LATSEQLGVVGHVILGQSEPERWGQRYFFSLFQGISYSIKEVLPWCTTVVWALGFSEEHIFRSSRQVLTHYPFILTIQFQNSSVVFR
jgi:hypothetical protein